MIAALVCGWAAAAAAALAAAELRRRLRLVGDAEHELRGPLTALLLGVERVGDPLASTLVSELARARAALADLTAAREGRRRARTEPAASFALEDLTRSCACAWGPDGVRAVTLDWRAGPAAVAGDPGRAAQALGNVVSNAVEHGTGPVWIRARRMGGAVSIEVANRTAAPSARSGAAAGDRGRGLRIAARAAREAGGVLRVSRGSGRVAAIVELPIVGGEREP
ncbi:MAG TPA: ATP-binding protein [Thermoleophilaceae bacterium]